jgi:hypothetical protein
MQRNTRDHRGCFWQEPPRPHSTYAPPGLLACG